MEQNQKQLHPLYPETVLQRICPKCESTDLYKVRGVEFCAACEQRAEDEIDPNDEKAYKQRLIDDKIEAEIDWVMDNGLNK